ncbi:MAG: hypothetical protein ABI540_10535 [Spartobacteria bacterium]
MKIQKQRPYEKVILGLELFGFAAVILTLWLDEYVDVPFYLFGAPKTPARPQEFWFETLTVLLVAAGVVIATVWVFRRLRLMENFIQVCAWCRKVHLAEEWISFEQYLKRTHDVRSTHSICPACRSEATVLKHSAIPI